MTLHDPIRFLITVSRKGLLPTHLARTQMYKISRVLALCALLLGIADTHGIAADAESPEPSGKAETLRVLAWNIEWFPGRRIEPEPEAMVEHMAVVQEQIKLLNPDVLLAQEIRSWQDFSDLVSVVPGLKPAVVSAFSNEETGEYWRQQLAIATNLPVFAAWSEAWKEGRTVTPRRGFSAAALVIPGTEKLLLVYSVHLKSNRSSNEQEEQFNFETRNESVRQLLEHVRNSEEVLFKGRIAGVIVGGDFNTNHDGQFADEVIELMVQGGFFNTWKDVDRDDRLTWRGSSRFVPTTFDFIFTKGLPELKAELLAVPEGNSDHWPLLLEIPKSWE